MLYKVLDKNICPSNWDVSVVEKDDLAAPTTPRRWQRGHSLSGSGKETDFIWILFDLPRSIVASFLRYRDYCPKIESGRVAKWPKEVLCTWLARTMSIHYWHLDWVHVSLTTSSMWWRSIEHCVESIRGIPRSVAVAVADLRCCKKEYKLYFKISTWAALRSNKTLKSRCTRYLRASGWEPLAR